MSIDVSKVLQTLKALLLIAMIALVLFAIGLANANKAEAWLARGPIYQYPNTGGTWKYGFWNAQVRSYYWVNRRHGSTVKLNGSREISVCTRPGYRSKADLWAAQAWWHDDRYFYWVC